MSELEQQLRAALGMVGYCMLMKSLRKFEIRIDPDDKCLIVYRDKHEPVLIGFDVIEEFVNNVH